MTDPNAMVRRTYIVRCSHCMETEVSRVEVTEPAIALLDPKRSAFKGSRHYLLLCQPCARGEGGPQAPDLEPWRSKTPGLDMAVIELEQDRLRQIRLDAVLEGQLQLRMPRG